MASIWDNIGKLAGGVADVAVPLSGAFASVASPAHRQLMQLENQKEVSLANAEARKAMYESRAKPTSDKLTPTQLKELSDIKAAFRSEIRELRLAPKGEKPEAQAQRLKQIQKDEDVISQIDLMIQSGLQATIPGGALGGIPGNMPAVSPLSPAMSSMVNQADRWLGTPQQSQPWWSGIRDAASGVYNALAPALGKARDAAQAYMESETATRPMLPQQQTLTRTSPKKTMTQTQHKVGDIVTLKDVGDVEIVKINSDGSFDYK